jgi:hypothetical protein
VTLHDLTEALDDSNALAQIATQAGVTVAQAKALAAGLGNLSATQMARLCGMAHADRERQKRHILRKRR